MRFGEALSGLYGTPIRESDNRTCLRKHFHNSTTDSAASTSYQDNFILQGEHMRKLTPKCLIFVEGCGEGKQGISWPA